jgi:hypothetical protein
VVRGVDRLDAAISEGNDIAYGLSAGIFSRDQKELQYFLDTAQAGVLYADRASGATTGAWPGAQPFDHDEVIEGAALRPPPWFTKPCTIQKPCPNLGDCSSVPASSSTCSLRIRPHSVISLPRSRAGSFAHAFCALAAISTAASRSASLPSAV